MSVRDRRRIFFSPDYVVDIGEHTFPTKKWALTAERIEAEDLSGGAGLEDPGLPPREFLLLAHAEAWVDKVLSGRMSLDDEMRMELPWSAVLSLAHQKQVMGTLEAAREALKTGLGLHVGGGAHHAFADYGEGFCLLNDLAIALIKLARDGAVERAAVVDLDVHQGNGTASILAGNRGLSTFSMHQADLYPEEKHPSTVDVGLPAGTADEKYLKLLSENLDPFLEAVGPELVVYQAGVDGWANDLLGGLELSAEGLASRDRMVAEACFKRGIPAAVVLGGGYAEDVAETAVLHARTLTVFAQAHRRFWSG